MSFKDLLKNSLKNKLNEKELENLPSGYQALNNICIVNLNKKVLRYKKEIGKKILELFPRFIAVYNKKDVIKGVFRKPQLEFLAGNKKIKEVKIIENNCIYCFDFKKIMFAKGNINERIRIAKCVNTEEIIVDMFAGIGYFSIPIGKFSYAKKIYSIELNPLSFKYLKKNIELNKIKNIEPIFGDNRKIIKKLKKENILVDRIIMGYLPPPKKFFKYALLIIKNKGIIHYETLLNKKNLKREIEKNLKELKEIALKKNKKVELIKVNYVKSYKPHINHYTLDIQVFNI
ncbi:MAG: RsmD family RNA methyltransferase [Candidatus Pacearchaeota archaeon]